MVRNVELRVTQISSLEFCPRNSALSLLGFKPKVPLIVAVLGSAQHSVQEYLTRKGREISKFVNNVDSLDELYDFLRQKRIEAVEFALERLKDLRQEDKVYVEQRLIDWNLRLALIEATALINAHSFFYSYELPKPLMFERKIECFLELELEEKVKVKLYGHPDIVILDPYSQTGLIFDYKTGDIAPLSEWVKPWEFLQLNLYSYILNVSKSLVADVGCIIYTQLFGLPFYMRPVRLNRNVEQYIGWAVKIKLGLEKIPAIVKNNRCSECSLRGVCFEAKL